MTLRRRLEALAHYAAWADYARRNANAADLYEAMPVAFNHYQPLPKCACGTPTINTRCRWCRRGRKP